MATIMEYKHLILASIINANFGMFTLLSKFADFVKNPPARAAFQAAALPKVNAMVSYYFQVIDEI